jgi:hypothetical protein
LRYFVPIALGYKQREELLAGGGKNRESDCQAVPLRAGQPEERLQFEGHLLGDALPLDEVRHVSLQEGHFEAANAGGAAEEADKQIGNLLALSVREQPRVSSIG